MSEQQQQTDSTPAPRYFSADISGHDLVLERHFRQCWGPGGEGALLRDATQALSLVLTEVKTTVRLWGSFLSVLLALAIAMGGAGIYVIRGVVAESSASTARTLVETQATERAERKDVSREAASRWNVVTPEAHAEPATR